MEGVSLLPPVFPCFFSVLPASCATFTDIWCERTGTGRRSRTVGQETVAHGHLLLGERETRPVGIARALNSRSTPVSSHQSYKSNRSKSQNFGSSCCPLADLVLSTTAFVSSPDLRTLSTSLPQITPTPILKYAIPWTSIFLTSSQRCASSALP